jgi:hypothetical protein
MMSEQYNASEQIAPGPSDQQEHLSFLDRAAGVFYEPSKVFESLKASGVKIGDWLIPVAILALLVGISTYVRFSSPDLRFQVAQQQMQRIDKMVAEGKMTAEAAEQAKESMQSGSAPFMWFGIFGAFIGTFVIFFAAATVWWIIAKAALKGSVDYIQMMGVAGISTWISIVGAILSIFLTVLLSRLDGGLHLGMLVKMNTSNKTYSLLRSADLFNVWNLAVTSIGIGTLSGKKGPLPFVWVFGIWIVFVLLGVFLVGGMYGG